MAHRVLACLYALGAGIALLATREAPAETPPPARQVPGDHVVLAWNDLGMHCMNGEFSQLVILPPFNNVWAQVIKRGDPPELIELDTVLDYRFPDNTTSSNKVNFWQYEDALFGANLTEDIGLAGKGLSGQMDWNGTAWEAHGIPLTPFDDANPTVEQPFQLAEVTLRATVGGPILDQTLVVAPVSTEIHCDTCHDGTGDKSSPAARAAMLERVSQLVPGKTTDSARPKAVDPIVSAQDILQEHDSVDGISLMDRRPVLCATCHASNALGTTGRPGVRSLSESIHAKHAEVSSTLDCYACHPGTSTKCFRGAMLTAGKTCTDCHGTLSQVANSISEGRRPWFDEPKCGSCHPGYEENANKLYRNSKGHSGVYCAACHGSPHAELPSTQSRDNLQAIRVQRLAKPIFDCMVCHTVQPTSAGPHGMLPNPPDHWLTY